MVSIKHNTCGDLHKVRFMQHTSWFGWLLVLGQIASLTASSLEAGTVDSPTEWSGEVHLTEMITVAANGVLRIQPGTRVIVSPGAGLTVKGQLLAEATDDAPISFDPTEGEERKLWPGIVIAPADHKTSPSKLVGCQIRGAENGILLTADAAGPHYVVKCTITSCRGAGIVLQNVSGPVIQQNDISSCGASGQSPSGGIWAADCRYATVTGNTIMNCARYGIVLHKGDVNTVRENTIQGIGGKPRSTEGMGIVAERSSNRNLIQSNNVSNCNYNGIVIYSRENQVIGNEVGNSPDGMGLAGAACTGNIVRDNRITRGWWSTLYVTSMARDNYFFNNVVLGGDGGITTRAAGPNLWENCHFYNYNSRGSVALLGTGIATFRRCTVKTNGPHDLQLEYGSYARVIDGNFDKHRISFGAGTGKHNYVEFLHTVEVHVTDAAGGRPIDGAAVTVESEASEEPRAHHAVTTAGKAAFEVLETTVRKDGLHDAGPYRVTVTAKGFQTRVFSGIHVTGRLNLDAQLDKKS